MCSGQNAALEIAMAAKETNSLVTIFEKKLTSHKAVFYC